MENKFLVVFLCGAMICFCSAEFTADMVYEILSGKLDVLFFTIKNMRNDINDINEKVETSDRGQCKEQCEEVKALFESFKTEMNDRFEILEVKITKKVDNLVKEALVSINHSVDEKLSGIERKRSKESDNLKTNMRKFVASEKLALRKSNDQFENDARKNIKNITDVFEGRIHNVEQIVSLFTNSSEVRIIDVENKMFAFENASWKGERGDIGPAGQKGQRGITGEKGDTGKEGSKGKRGITGEKGDTGKKGSKGKRGITGEKGDTGKKGSKGEKGIGLKGQKGESGYTEETESRKRVYFSVDLGENKIIYENTTVKFDRVFSNHGGGYSSSTGIFTAPYSGAYLFLFFVSAVKYKYAYLQLYVDGRYRTYTIIGSAMEEHELGLAGQAYVEYMSAGDKAWIQTGDLTGGSYHNIYNIGTTFTGILIN